MTIFFCKLTMRKCLTILEKILEGGIFMDVDARKEFWEVLLKAKNESDIAMVNSKIIYPEKIYRYRSISTRTLNAIAENEIYFSTPSKYDDPFDTYINVNKLAISEQIKKLNPNSTKTFYEFLENNFSYIPEGIKQKILESKILSQLKDTTYKLRENIWTACFTEKFDNETMWLKYAKNHEGLVLEYDVKDLKNKTLFLKTDKTEERCIVNPKLNFYPIYYSDEVYDSTNYALFRTLIYLLEQNPIFYDIIDLLISDGFQNWELERILLKKHYVHHYDEEWRLILNNKYTINRKLNPRIIIRPSKIILGLNISPDDKKAVLRVAENAGIENIEQMIINDNDEFVAEPIKRN